IAENREKVRVFNAFRGSRLHNLARNSPAACPGEATSGGGEYKTSSGISPPDSLPVVNYPTPIYLAVTSDKENQHEQKGHFLPHAGRLKPLIRCRCRARARGCDPLDAFRGAGGGGDDGVRGQAGA